MRVLIGNVSLISTIFCGVLFSYFALRRLVTNQTNDIATSLKLLGYTPTVAAGISFLVLLSGYIVSDFTIQNVVFYSSSIAPLIYKLAGSWANHDGSMLFWTSLLAIVNCCALMTAPNPKLWLATGLFYNTWLVILACFSYFEANPFVLVSSVPLEGLGTNPVLQDVALSIHPPILYIGYVCYSVPCAYCLAALFFKDEQQRALEACVNFAAIGWLALTSGVILGAWWAYRELGWGGYWSFDPVENISLIPWLFATAFQHNLLITRKSGKMLASTLLLGAMCFVVVIIGMMLVRSGVLVSVHNFATNFFRGQYVLDGGVILGGVVAIAYLKQPRVKDSLNSSEKIVKLGGLALLFAAIILIAAIIFPLLVQLVKGYSANIGEGYYHYCFLPVGIVAVVLMGMAGERKKNLFWGISAITILWYYNIQKPLAIAGIIASCFTITTLQRKNFPMLLSHLGIAIITLAITLNGTLSRDINFIGKVGDIIQQEGFTIELKAMKYSKGPNYFRQIAVFWVTDNAHNTVFLKPENRLYQIENALSSESDIYSFLTHDLYAILGQVDDEVVQAQIFYRPWISWIWLGGAMTAGGILTMIATRSPKKFRFA